MTGIAEEVRALVEERDAVLLAHNYQVPEVQEVADFVGDSLGLARQAAETDASVIVFAGVLFMAETAKILAPDRTVLLPEPEAGCPMADMCTAEQLRQWRDRHPGVPVVTYVNSSADAKALSDVCCTSANAVDVVRSLGVSEVLFGPDRNLAAWVASVLPDVHVVPWDGYCPVHDYLTVEEVEEVMAAHPGAEVIAHPECRAEVLKLAGRVLSTSQMLMHAADSGADEFIVLTESGLLYSLQKAAPGKRFHHPVVPMICPNMKLTSLESLRDALRDMEHEIEIAEDVRAAALGAVERMVVTG